MKFLPVRTKSEVENGSCGANSCATVGARIVGVDEELVVVGVSLSSSLFNFLLRPILDKLSQSVYPCQTYQPNLTCLTKDGTYCMAFFESRLRA